MRLRNKKSGEVKDFELFDGKDLHGGVTLKCLTEEWEDAPDDIYYSLSTNGNIHQFRWTNSAGDRMRDELGNKFSTEDEAREAVKRLCAWKRLKDKGFKFTGINDDEKSQYSCNQTGILCEINEEEKPTKLCKDNDFLAIFGGEEEIKSD